ncbi:MAG: hypothetical protein M0P71_13830 [Melioribacteraceae bacterium]|nr:hypothetical protein [Melioribacteraceae bacterium]
MTTKEFKVVEIHSVNDIKKALIPFSKIIKKDETVLNPEIEWEDEQNNVKVKMKTQLSIKDNNLNLRDLLLEGFEQVKEQEKSWNNIHDALEDDEYSVTLPRMKIDDFHMPVDRLIKTRLGGKRKGLAIVWNLNNKEYSFDPYTCEFKGE